MEINNVKDSRLLLVIFIFIPIFKRKSLISSLDIVGAKPNFKYCFNIDFLQFLIY